MGDAKIISGTARPYGIDAVTGLTDADRVTPMQLLKKHTYLDKEILTCVSNSSYSFKQVRFDDFHVLIIKVSGTYTRFGLLWTADSDCAANWTSTDVASMPGTITSELQCVWAIDRNRFAGIKRNGTSSLTLYVYSVDWEASTVAQDHYKQVTINPGVSSWMYSGVVDADTIVLQDQKTRKLHFVDLSSGTVLRTQDVPYLFIHSISDGLGDGSFIGTVCYDSNVAIDFIQYTLTRNSGFSLLSYKRMTSDQKAWSWNYNRKAFSVRDGYVYYMYSYDYLADNYGYNYYKHRLCRTRIEGSGFGEQEIFHDDFLSTTDGNAQLVHVMAEGNLFVSTDGSATTISPSAPSDIVLLYSVDAKTQIHLASYTYYNANEHIYVNPWFLLRRESTGYSGSNYYGYSLRFFGNVCSRTSGFDYNALALTTKKPYGLIDIAKVR